MKRRRSTSRILRREALFEGLFFKVGHCTRVDCSISKYQAHQGVKDAMAASALDVQEKHASRLLDGDTFLQVVQSAVSKQSEHREHREWFVRE